MLPFEADIVRKKTFFRVKITRFRFAAMLFLNLQRKNGLLKNIVLLHFFAAFTFYGA